MNTKMKQFVGACHGNKLFSDPIILTDTIGKVICRLKGHSEQRIRLSYLKLSVFKATDDYPATF
jgi:hypothetical protein